MEEISHHGRTVGAYSGEVSLDAVALASIVELDSVPIQADDVAGSGDRATYRIVGAAGNFDAVKIVAFCGARRRRGLCPVAHAAEAVLGNADEIALDFVSGCRRGESARDVNPTDRVPRSNVPVSVGGAADGVIGGVLDKNAVAELGNVPLGIRVVPVGSTPMKLPEIVLPLL